MPRQLPWKSNGGGGSCITVKQLSRPAETIRIPDGTEDGFLNSTGLASKFKGKARAALDLEGSHLDLSMEPSTPRTKITKPDTPKEHMPSSSPSSIANNAAPCFEPMRKGVSKFDLRDDEWMMVEDEFLETAKFFTQHLHIAEYERLKESIEAKKKEAGVVARPVVAGARYSVEGTIKERAKVQETKQKKSVLDIFALQHGSREGHGVSYRSETSSTPLALATPRSATNASPEMDSDDMDSDDLDAQYLRKLETSVHSSVTPKVSQYTLPHISEPAAPSFVKPTLPVSKASARPRGTPSRMMPFDMLDEYATSKVEPTLQASSTSCEACASTLSKHYSQSTLSTHSSLQTAQTTATLRLRKSFDLLDDWSSSKDNGNISKEVVSRTAKRKTEREKRDGDRRERKTTNLDDVPTFLF